MVDHHPKASKPRTPPESQPRIGLTGDPHFETCFFELPETLADGKSLDGRAKYLYGRDRTNSGRT